VAIQGHSSGPKLTLFKLSNQPTLRNLSSAAVQVPEDQRKQLWLPRGTVRAQTNTYQTVKTANTADILICCCCAGA
jgi:hypothetical protein